MSYYIYNFKSPLIGTFYVSRITNNKTKELMLTCKRSSAQVKDEYKETDGQPEVKQKIRKLQAEAANKSRKENEAIDNLGEATAIITNPTHFAVALKYEVGEASAPVVICKGKGLSNY